MPTDGSMSLPSGVGSIGMSNVGRFAPKTVSQASRYLISGLTIDAATNVVGNVTVDVYETVLDIIRGSTISDASGNYAVEIAGDIGLTFYVRCYKVGSPDLAGTTVNTLVAS